LAERSVDLKVVHWDVDLAVYLVVDLVVDLVESWAGEKVESLVVLKDVRKVGQLAS